MSYYNCCGIRPKHINISKRVWEGVIIICVVLDQSIVIFQKVEGYYNLCGIRSKSWPNGMKNLLKHWVYILVTIKKTEKLNWENKIDKMNTLFFS